LPLLTAKLHLRYVKESEIMEARSRS